MPATTTPTYDGTTGGGFLSADPDANRLYDNVQAVVPGLNFSLLQMMLWNTIEDFYIRSTLERRWQSWQMANGIQEVVFNPYDENWLVAWLLDYTGLNNALVIPPATIVDVCSGAVGLRQGTVLLALKPTSFAASLPASLWSTWFEAIKSGTLARLYELPAKPWSNPQIAVEKMREYRAGVSQARSYAQNQYTDGGGRWSFPYFARGRRKQ